MGFYSNFNTNTLMRVDWKSWFKGVEKVGVTGGAYPPKKQVLTVARETRKIGDS